MSKFGQLFVARIHEDGSFEKMEDVPRFDRQGELEDYIESEGLVEEGEYKIAIMRDVKHYQCSTQTVTRTVLNEINEHFDKPEDSGEPDEAFEESDETAEHEPEVYA